MIINDNKKVAKSSKNFNCSLCDYSSAKKSNFEKHLKTRKHQLSLNGNFMVTKSSKSSTFFCECGKKYVFNSGLSRHKKVCKYSNNIILFNNTDNIDKKVDELSNTLKDVVKQNEELKNEIKTFSNEPKQIICQNNNTINNFNLNVFLNEECKDALNISEFVKELQIGFKELEYTNKNGIDKSILNVFINGLEDVGIYKRPIHSTDVKREIVYIKNNDKWCKESTKSTLKKELEIIQNKQINKLQDLTNNKTRFENEKGKEDYLNLVQNVMTNINEHKIIKEIIKTTHIKKNNN